MGVSRPGSSRALTAFAVAVLVLSSLGVDAALGPMAGAVAPPPDLCERASACVLDASGKERPVLWEGDTTTLTVAVAEPSPKPRPFRLVVGPADGRADRIRKFHRFDVPPGVGGNENGLPDEIVLTVPAEAQTVHFDVRLKGDEEIEADEWFDLHILDITDPNGPVSHGHVGVAVIDTTPAEQVELELKTDPLPEGEVRSVLVTYSGPAEQADVTLVATDRSPAGGLAHGRKAEIYPPAVRIERGERQTVEVTVVDDGVEQPDAPVILIAFAYPADLDLDPPEPVTPVVGGRARPIHGASEPITVIDPPPLPARISIGDARASESSGAATLTVRRSGNLDQDLTLPVTYGDGTAVAGLDFATPDGGAPATVLVRAGATAATLVVPLIDDDVYEGDETFTVHLGATSGVVLDDPTATVTIDDEDDRPVPTIGPGSVRVGAGGGTVGFELEVPVAPAVGVPYRVSTADIDAVAGVDYLAFDQVVTVPAGATRSDRFTVEVLPTTSPGTGLSLRFQVDVTHPTDGSHLGTAVVTIEDEATTAPGGDVPDVLRDGILDWLDSLGGWHGSFRLPELEWTSEDGDPLALPTMPDLDDVFDLEELLGGLPRPHLDVDADILEDAVDDLAGAGCPVEFVVGGIGGAPEPTDEGDIIQVRCAWTVEDLSGGDWSGPVQAPPAGLADLFAAQDLDLDVAWSAGSLEVVLVAGVDAAGFYVLGPSGVGLRDVDGLGRLDGEGSLLGEPADLSGTVGARLDVLTTLAGPDDRIRIGVLPDMIPAELGTRLVGSVELDVSAAVGGTSLTWSGRWAAPADGPPDVVTEQELTVRQAIPGLAVGEEPDPVADAVLELRGTYGTCSGQVGWQLDGALTAAGPMALAGFTITEVGGEGCLTTDGLDLQVQIGLVLGDPDDPEAGQVDLVLQVDPHGWDAELDLVLPELRVGPVVAADVALDVDASHRDGSSSLVVVASAARAALHGLDDGELAVLEGVEVELRGSGQLSLTAEQLRAELPGGALQVEADDVALTTPGTDGVLLRSDEARGLAPNLGEGLTVTITGLVIYDDGRFAAATASVEQPSGIARSIGLGGLIPFDVTALRLDFTTRQPDGTVDDLSRFEVALDGEIDAGRLAELPFDPIIRLGGDPEAPCVVPVEGITQDSPLVDRQLSLRAAVRITSSGAVEVTPVDLGPITLGLRNLRAGALTFSAVVCADGYADGVLQPGFGGSARIEGGFDSIDGAVTADIGGTFVAGPHGVEVHADATVGFSLARGGGIELRGLTTRLGLELGFDAEGQPFVHTELAEVSVGSASVPFGPFADLSLTDATLDLDPEEGATVFTIGGSLADPGTGASIAFRDGLAMLDGWGGRVGGIAIDTDFGLRVADGFFVDITVPDGERFGLPDFLPLEVHRIGLALPAGIEAGDPLTDILGNMVLTVSGGLAGTVAFPVSASVDELTVDLGKLAGYRPLEHGFNPAHFPVGLDGLRFAIEPSLQLGSASVSGGLSFGTVTVEGSDGPEEVLYGHISGGLRTPVLEAGADVVISQYGPVLLRVTAPAGVPLGQTGLVLMSVTGAAAFGDVEIPVDPGHPEQLLAGLDDLPTNVSLDEATIAERIAGSVVAARPTWEDGFALGLAGQLTHVATAGMISGTVTAAVNVRPDGGPQFVAAGEIEVFGIPLSAGEAGGSLAVAGMLLDLKDPLAPSLSFAFQAPTPGSPLAALFPVQTSAEAELRTDGVVEGLVAGTAAAFDSLAGSATAGIARHLDGDRANPLSRLLLDLDGDGSVSPSEGDRAITAGLLASRLDALLADGRGGEVFGSLIVALGAYVETLDATAAAALLSDFFAALAEGAEAALRVAGEVFDPSLLIRARVQTALFGIPIGDPAQELELVLDKTSFGFSTSSSVMSTLSRQVTGLDLLGPVLSDQLTFGVQVPIPNMVDVLFGHGEVGRLDSEDPGQSWSVTIAGSITVNGLTAEVGGFMTGPGNAVLVDARVEPRWECYEAGPVPERCAVPPDPDRVQLSRQVDYDNLLAYGGMVLYGALEVPRILTDPVDVVGELPDLPEDPLAVLGWFDDFATTIGQVDKPLQVVAFIPGLPESGAGEEAIDAWLAAVSVTGVFEGTRQTPESDPVARLLSIPIGQGRMVATREGVEVTAEVPLLGTRGTFVARVDEVDHEGRTVAVPAGKLEVSLSAADLGVALAQLGLPEAFEVSAVDGAVGARAYTPGFDPGSPDPLARNGGLAITAQLDAEGFVERARAEVVVELAGAGDGPDFRATASVDRLGPFGGVAVADAGLTVTKEGSEVSVDTTGTVELLGTVWTVQAHLRPDLTGRLELVGSGEEGPSFAGFDFVSGGVVINLTREGAAIVGSVGVGGVVALPDWLAGRAATSTVQAAGCLAGDARAELRLGLGRVELAPGGLALAGTGRPLPTLGDGACTLPPMPEMDLDDARLVVRLDGPSTTVAVDGAVWAPDGTEPLVSATGSWSSEGTGSLTVSLGPGGIDLGGFVVTGGGTLSLRSGGQFDLVVGGSVEVPGIGTLNTSGHLTGAGDFDLVVDTGDGLRLGGAGSPFVAVASARIARTGGVYRFGATDAGVQYRQGTTVLFSVTVPSFEVGSDGSFDLATAPFVIGSAHGVRLEAPASRFVGQAGGTGFRLRIPAVTQLAIPGLADGSSGRPKLALGRAVDIDTATSRFVLLDATGNRAIDLGLLELSGRLVLERVSGGFQLSLEGGSRPAHVEVGSLGRLEVGTVRFGADGSFDVAVRTRRLGSENPRFALAGSSVRLRNQGGVFELALRGGTLELPSVPAPIPLGDLAFRATASFQRDVTVGAIGLGPVFRTTASARFRLVVSPTASSFTLLDTGASGPRMQALAGSADMRLETFYVDTDGAFEGRVRGQLRVAGSLLASGIFDVRLRQGLFELHLPAPGLQVDWGFGRLRLTGWARSDGQYDMSGAISSTGAVAGVLSWSGTATMRARTSGLSGRFVGRVNMNILGVSVGSSVDLGVSASGQVSGTARFRVQICVGTICYLEYQDHQVAFRLGSGNLRPDTTPPSMAQPPDVEVFTSKSSGTIPVQFPHPVADDSRDGPILSVCNPASGSSFRVRRSTSVSCTATDAAGNRRTRTFQVHVRDSVFLFDQSGLQMSTGLDGMLGGTEIRGVLFSEPVQLFSTTAAGDGSATVRFVLPDGIEPGPHHLVMAGTGAGGAPRHWVVPLTIDEHGNLASIEAEVVPADRPRQAPVAVAAEPVAALPRTGASSLATARGGALLLAAGSLLSACARLLGARRRPLRR